MLEDYPGPQKDKSLGGRNPQLVDLWSPNNVISIFKATISHEKYLFVCPKCNAEYSRDAKNADGRNGDCLSCARILSAKKMRKNQKLKFPKKEESLGGLNTNRLQFPIGGGSL
jgi:hypothetical protein